MGKKSNKKMRDLLIILTLSLILLSLIIFQIYSTSEKLEFEKEYYASQMLNFCTLAKIYESKLLAVGAEIPKLNQSCEYYILPDDKK